MFPYLAISQAYDRPRYSLMQPHNQTMGDEEREGVTFSHLDQELFDGAGANKRDLVDYLDAMAERMLPGLADRPLSVVRVRPGQPPFMQKNLPKYTPEWVERVPIWAEASKREVSYPLATDRRTLLWFANQRAVEYHVTLFRMGHWNEPDYLVMDLDPPEGSGFDVVAATAALVRAALTESGLNGSVKTSGAKGLHVFVPLAVGSSPEDVAAGTRALAARAERIDPDLATTAFVKEDRHGKVFLDSTRAGGATVVAAYSPRIRPGVPVSFPVAWDDVDRVTPGRLHRPHGPGPPRRHRPVARIAAGAAETARRSDRRRTRDSHRPRAGHARRQAPSPVPPRLREPVARSHPQPASVRPSETKSTTNTSSEEAVMSESSYESSDLTEGATVEGEERSDDSHAADRDAGFAEGSEAAAGAEESVVVNPDYDDTTLDNATTTTSTAGGSDADSTFVDRDASARE